MTELKKLEEDFEKWKLSKDSKLLTLYKTKSTLEKSGKETEIIDQKITIMEKEIDQKKAKLERDMLKIFKKMDLGNSREAKDARRERTHRLCQLGSLVEKAGFNNITPASLLGLLLYQKEYLDTNPSILSRWEERGKVALNISPE